MIRYDVIKVITNIKDAILEVGNNVYVFDIRSNDVDVFITININYEKAFRLNLRNINEFVKEKHFEQIYERFMYLRSMMLFSKFT